MENMKISDSKALELLESIPMSDVSNEANFLAPLHVKGRSVSTEFADPNNARLDAAKKRIAEALGQTQNDNIWFEIQYNNSTGVHKIKGTLLNDSVPIKVVS
jgi:hypothetical protein